MHNAAVSPALVLLAAALAAAQTAEQYLERAGREPSPQERITLATLALQATTEPLEKTGALVTRADAYSQLCRHQDALSDADAAVAASPSDDSGYLTRAQVRAAAGRCEGAFADMRKVFDILGEPDLAALIARAGVRGKCKAPVDSILADRRAAAALALKAGDRRTQARQFHAAARALCGAKRYDEGLAEAAKAEATGAFPAESHVIAGRCLLDAGRKNEALPRLDLGIRLAEAAPPPEPQTVIKDDAEMSVVGRHSFSLAPAYSDRARLLQAAGRLDDAIADLGKAIAATPEPPPACRAKGAAGGELYRRRAELRAKKGETAFAREDYAAACSAGDKKSCAKSKPAKKR